MNHTAHVDELIIAAISVGYLGFSACIWFWLWRFRVPFRKALPAHGLALVFVLCDFSGYLSVIMPLEYMHWRTVSHTLLAAVVLPLMFTGLPKWIAKSAQGSERDF